MNVPRYRQIADELRARITAGDYAVGDKLPPLLQLQREFDVPGINTVRHALQVLTEQGLVRTDRGRGTFVIATDYPAAGRDDLLAALRQARDTVDRAIAYLEKTQPECSSPEQSIEAAAQQDTPPRPANLPSGMPAKSSTTPPLSDALLRTVIEATGATTPDSDMWPDTVEALATRRNRAVALTQSSESHVEATFMRRGRSRDADYKVDSISTYSPSDAATAVHDIRRYLTPR